MLIKLVKYKNRSYILQYYCTGKKTRINSNLKDEKVYNNI